MGTVALRPGASLTGRVTDVKGRPIAEAEVRIVESGRMSFLALLAGLEEEPAALSAADGRFRVSGLDPGQAVDVAVTRRGYGRADALRVEPAAAPLAITLHPALRLSGRVVGPRGEPVPRAELILTGMRQHGGDVAMSTPLRGESDEEGRFAFKEVEPGTLHLIATAPGWQPGTLAEISAADEDVEGLELVLSPAGAVEGRVTDAAGRPVPGASVSLAEGEAEAVDLSRLFGASATDGDGWYRVEGLALGPRSIAAEDDQGRRTVGEVEVRPGVARLDLRFRRGVEVAGRVVDAAGAPVAGVWVNLFGDSAASEDHGVRTGADGAFVLADVENGTYRLEASSKGHAEAELGPLEIAGADVVGLEIRLDAGGTVVGRVLGVEPELLSRVEVHGGRQGEGFQFQRGMVDHEGRYRLPNLAAGEWLVVAELRDSGRRVQGLVTLEPGVAEAALDLDFDTGFTLSGRVTRDGAPLPGATIEAHGRGVSDRGSASTDRDGRFRIRSLEAGTYEVTVYAGTATRREEMALTGDREVSFELEMAAVAGRVIDAIERTPVAGALGARRNDRAGSESPLEEPDRHDDRFTGAVPLLRSGGRKLAAAHRARGLRGGRTPARGAGRCRCRGAGDRARVDARAGAGCRTRHRWRSAGRRGGRGRRLGADDRGRRLADRKRRARPSLQRAGGDVRGAGRWRGLGGGARRGGGARAAGLAGARAGGGARSEGAGVAGEGGCDGPRARRRRHPLPGAGGVVAWGRLRMVDAGRRAEAAQSPRRRLDDRGAGAGRARLERDGDARPGADGGAGAWSSARPTCRAFLPAYLCAPPIPSSSTSKTRSASGGMTSPAPRLP